MTTTAIQVRACRRCGGSMYTGYYSESSCFTCGCVVYRTTPEPKPESGHGVRRLPYVGDGVHYRTKDVAIRAYHGQRVILACPRGDCADPMKPDNLPFIKRYTRFVCEKGHYVRLTTKDGVRGWV